MKRVLVGVTTAIIMVATACSTTAGDAPAEQFFRAVVAGKGAGGAVSGTANVHLLDPKFASQRAPGSLGTQPGSKDAVVVIFTGAGATKLIGTYTDTAVTASGNGWTAKATYDAQHIEGSFSDPNGDSGGLAGLSLWQGRIGTFCGDYSGSASGTWNLTVADSGMVEGSFAGAASGSLSGTASGTSVSLTWTEQASASGTAQGTIDASSTIHGTWTGAASGTKVSGTWNSTNSCPGDAPVMGPSSSCNCAALIGGAATSACCPGGACCET